MAEPLPAAFVAVTVYKRLDIIAVGVPEIKPVLLFSATPTGKAGVIVNVAAPPELLVVIEITLFTTAV